MPDVWIVCSCYLLHICQYDNDGGQIVVRMSLHTSSKDVTSDEYGSSFSMRQPIFYFIDESY